MIDETAAQTRQGRGVCVGSFFSPPLRYRIIPVTDEPISYLEDVPSLPEGEIGELLVSGPQVSPCYVTRTEANKLALVQGANQEIWRRVGDVGYLDKNSRFWFCGRKSHRVETPYGPMFTIPCEAIANTSSKVFRSALVGVPLPSDYRPPENISERNLMFAKSWREPVMIVEPYPKSTPENAVEEVGAVFA